MIDDEVSKESKNKDCSHCNGTGDDPRGRKDRTGDVLPCPYCKGSGIE